MRCRVCIGLTVLLSACRIAGCFLLIYVCWDIKAVFYAIWSPFTFLVGYNDPRKPTDDVLHGGPTSQSHLNFLSVLCPHKRYVV